MIHRAVYNSLPTRLDSLLSGTSVSCLLTSDCFPGPSPQDFLSYFGASPQSGTANVAPSCNADLCAMTPMAM